MSAKRKLQSPIVCSERGYVANKVLHTTQLHAPAYVYTGTHSLASCNQFYTLFPKPTLHKVTLSWWTPKNLHAEIVRLFGPRKGNSFLNGLFLRKVKDRQWWSVVFNAEDNILASLAKLREKISPWPGSVQLKQVEVAWNLPCSSYQDAKELMLNLAQNTLLQGVYARLWLEPQEGGKIDENKDGTKNGEQTVYFQQIRCRKNKYILVKNPIWDAKMYLKEINSIWHLHIEVTLEKRLLKASKIPMDIPTSVSPDWLKKLPLERFINFASFDMPTVIYELRRLLRTRQSCNNKKKYAPWEIHKMRIGLQILSSAMDYPACEQKRDACKVADIFKAVRFKQRIREGEFDCPYNPFAD